MSSSRRLPGEVEVDVGQRVHLLGDEALQGQVPAQGVDVADADQVAHQQRHRRAPASARRALLERRLGVGEAALLHDALPEQADLAVEQQEPRDAVALDEPELLRQTLLDGRA